MKTSLFSAFAAVALFAGTSAFAAPATNSFGHDRDRDDHRYDDRDDRDHRVTRQERDRWDAAHRCNDHPLSLGGPGLSDAPGPLVYSIPLFLLLPFSNP